MAIGIGRGFHLFALASLLFLAISVNANENVDHDQRLPLLPVDAADLELRGYSVLDVNDDAKPEDAWPLWRNRRVRRGIRFPKIKMPAIRPPTSFIPRFSVPSFKPGGFVRNYHPPPKMPAAFPNLVRAKPKTSVQGGGGLRKRWEDKSSKKIYEWDSQHGELEAYNKRGQHLGSYNPQTGQKIKDAVPGRKIEP